MPRIHQVPPRLPPSQREYFSAKTIVFDVPSAKPEEIVVLPSQSLKSARLPKTMKLPA